MGFQMGGCSATTPPTRIYRLWFFKLFVARKQLAQLAKRVLGNNQPNVAVNDRPLGVANKSQKGGYNELKSLNA